MKKLFLSVAVVSISSAACLGDTLASWGFESSAPAANYLPGAGVTTTNFVADGGTQSGTATLVGLHSAAATYSGPVGNASLKSLSVNTWTVGDYWQVQLSTVSSSGLSFAFDQAGSSTGPKDFTLSYSLDGSSFTSVGSYTVAASTWNSSAMPGFTHTFDLGSAIDNSPTVYLRLTDADTSSIGGATVGTGGTDRIDNVSVFTTPVPEPSAIALSIVGGLAGLVIWKRRK